MAPKINGIAFKPDPNQDYGLDLQKWYDEMQGPVPTGYTQEQFDRGQFRWLLERSLWAITAFVMRVPCAFHPFWIRMCVDVQNGPDTDTLDVWARGHGKSTIITCAKTIQAIIKNSEETACIFSYSRTAALKFFQQIKNIFESSLFLKWCYPDVFYENPALEAPKWSDDAGLFVKRKGFQKEPTLYAAGLIEAMPTGMHFSIRVYDDIMVEDLADSPEMMEKLKERFDLSENLGLDGGKKWVIGTPYHHDDIIQLLRGRKNPAGEMAYHLRLIPATEGAEWNGKPVFISQTYLDTLKANKRKFSSQQLLNPTPSEIQRLNPNYLILNSPAPENLYKFMLVDPAGERRDRAGDCWAIHVVGLEPFRDDLGASDLYLLDSCIEEMSYDDALREVVSMYLRNGRILQLGVEKVALSTTEVHVANALRSHGRYLSVEDGTLVVLRPAGRKKVDRIESNLVWPLNNGKIKISTNVKPKYVDVLKREMERFPYGHDDGIDALSYAYDLVKEYRFGKRPEDQKSEPRKKWLEEWQQDGIKHNWLVV